MARSPRRFVTRVGGRLPELPVDVAGQFRHRATRGGQLVFGDQSFDYLGGGIPPSAQCAGIGGGHADDPRDDHHRQCVGHTRHPFDAAVLHIEIPQVLTGPGNEGSTGADAFGRQVRQQCLAVRCMDRLVGGRQRLHITAEFTDPERGDAATRPIHHRRGQI